MQSWDQTLVYNRVDCCVVGYWWLDREHRHQRDLWREVCTTVRCSELVEPLNQGAIKQWLLEHLSVCVYFSSLEIRTLHYQDIY